jgi:hypothetical protein
LFELAALHVVSGGSHELVEDDRPHLANGEPGDVSQVLAVRHVGVAVVEMPDKAGGT